MSKTDTMLVRFWGVRGSLACPGPDTVRYGGNTSCLEVRCGEHLIILDAGTGLRPLGATLAGNSRLDADLLFSHTHLDHIVGLPFFQPLYGERNTLRLWAGHLKPDHTLMEVVKSMMTAPLFPVPPEMFSATTRYIDFVAGDTLDLKPGIVVRTAPLNHPDRATGYRIEYAGKSLCYVTDTEHDAGGLDKNILGLIDGADMLVYDATYTDAEYETHKGWGHSTWREGVRLADAGKVGRLIIFHHEPGHDDAFMDGVAERAEAVRPGTLVAREGMELDP